MISPKLYLNDKNYINPSKSIVQARNVMLDDNFEYVTNEKGFTKLHTFVNDICGVIDTPDYDIVFCTNNVDLSEIYKVNDVSKELVIQGDFGFTTSNPIKGVHQHNSLGELIVVWNDTSKPLGAINIDNPPIELNPDKTLVNAEDIFKLRLHLDAFIPNFNVQVKNGGTLPKGKYQIVTSYILNDYDTTVWSIPSTPVSVGLIRDTTLRYYAKSSKSNTVTEYEYHDKYQAENEDVSDKYIYGIIEDLDTRYDNIQVALIYITSTSTRAFNVGTFDIKNKTFIEINITTLPTEELSLNEVTIPYISYDTFKDICNHEGTLYGAGVGNDVMFDYQKYANNIKVNYGVGIQYSHDDILNNIHTITVTPDEVYALVINLIGTDGTSKGIFQIPGRAPKDGETRLLTSAEKDAIQGTANYVYQRDNTATSNVYGYNPDGAIESDLAYWENENERYPNKATYDIYDVDLSGDGYKIGTLAGEKVRHHKMPDFNKLYNVPTNSAGYINETRKNILLRFSDIKFPKEILDNIQGYIIGYVKRSSNDMTVLGHFPLIHTKFWQPYSQRSAYNDANRWGHRFNDINLIKHKPAISNPYLKGLFITNMTNDNLLDIDCTKISTFDSRVINVKNYKYIPYDNYASTPINKGREECLMLDLDEKEYSTYYNQSVLTAALKSNKVNVFTNIDNSRIALASRVYKVNKGTYAYSTGYISKFDSYNNVYYSNLYKGDATLEGDAVDGYSRPEMGDNNFVSDTNMLTSFKTISFSTMDVDFKSKTDSQTDIDFYKPAVFKDSTEYVVESNFNIDPSKDDDISYDTIYSKVNDTLALYVIDNNRARISSFPYRVARSLQQSKESLVLNWRYFPALDYYENVKHRGPIIGISSSDNILLIHHEHSLFIAKIKNRLKTSGEDAYIGTADLFEYRPEEFLPTNAGKAGLQSRFGKVIGEQGYVFVDVYEPAIYVYNNNGYTILSDDTIKKFLINHMVSSTNGNPLLSDDVIIGLDEKNDRLLLTSKGSDSFTLSYCYNSKVMSWISLHDYIPVMMFNNRRGSYNVSSDLKSIYKIDNDYDNIGMYHGTKKDSFIDVLLNDSTNISKELISVGLQSGLIGEEHTIDQLFIYTKNQCTNVITLEEFNNMEDWDKIRYIDNYWLYNFIRDYTSNAISQDIVNDFGDIHEDAIFIDKNWFELSNIIDRAFIVRLISNNNNRVLFRDIVYNVIVNSR